MSDSNNKVVVDSVSANIVDKHSQDKAILVGVFPYENSSYSQNLELVVKPDVGYPVKIQLPYSGYDMQLFCGDFTNDGKDEIMVRGSFGGSGGFEIGVIYKFDKNEIREIFNQNDISKNNSCSAKFKDNYKLNLERGLALKNQGKLIYTYNDLTYLIGNKSILLNTLLAKQINEFNIKQNQDNIK